MKLITSFELAHRGRIEASDILFAIYYDFAKLQYRVRHDSALHPGGGTP